MINSSRDHHTAHLSPPRFISLLLEQLKAFENLSKLDSDPITLQKKESRWSNCKIVGSYKHCPNPLSPVFNLLPESGLEVRRVLELGEGEPQQTEGANLTLT